MFEVLAPRIVFLIPEMPKFIDFVQHLPHASIGEFIGIDHIFADRHGKVME